MSSPILSASAGSQVVRWTYWPVSYQFGDPTVISNVPLPLSGVSYSEVMRGVGMLRGSLQLYDPEVRELDPWSKIVPRKTGLVAVREVFDPDSGMWFGRPMWHGIVWTAPSDPATGQMNITAQTVEGLWAKRLITKAISWTGVDQRQIAADLLVPSKFSKVPLGSGMFTGWVNVDPPVTNTGVLRTFSYADGQETSLLEAHQNRSQLATNSYEWTTSVRVLSGSSAVSASSFRVQYVMGYPRLGRSVLDDTPVPRLTYDRNGGGNVLTFQRAYDGSNVPNIVWGRGNGYDDLQVKTQVQNTDSTGKNEWDYGYMQTEERFSDADVSLVSTLRDYCYRLMWDRLGSEEYLSELELRGDIYPFFGDYVMGDQMILSTNDWTWPPDWYDASGFVDLLTRVYGWTVTPPEGERAETVKMVVSAGRAEL